MNENRLVIIAEKENNRWYVTSQGISTHGDGDTLWDAIDDFADSLFFYIQETVHESPELLGPHLLQQRAMLMDILGEKDEN